MDKKYIIDNEKLMPEWDWDKNNELGLDPNTMTEGSNKKAWWICNKNHSWCSVIASRAKGSGCPYCTNRKVLKGYNDLRTVNPAICSEWHPTKNGNLTPFDVTYGSEKKVWWLCSKCGYEWQSTIANRQHGNGCPNCKKNTISEKKSAYHLSKKGSLQETNPALSLEWHTTKNGNLSPNDFTEGSSRIVWWKGKCGHEWRASISNRSRGTQCPYCSNQKVLQGYNDLKTEYPDIAKEWNYEKNAPTKPSDVLYGSSHKYWWKCSVCSYEWLQSVHHRTARGQGCPSCAKKLQTSFPEQSIFFYIKQCFPDTQNGYKDIFNSMMELDVYIPSLKVGIEYDGVFWHSNNASLKKEQIKYDICKQNKIKLIRVRENSSENNSDNCDYMIPISRHASYKELENIINTILKLLNCNCDVDVKRDAISIQSNYFRKIKERTLKNIYPELAEEWHPTKNGTLTPDMFSVSSGVKVWWLCKNCGNVWEASIADRSAGHGCKICRYKTRIRTRMKNQANKKGSFAKLKPELLDEWDYSKNIDINPNEIIATSGISVWWKCSKCGHEWKQRIISRNEKYCRTCREVEKSNQLSLF